MGLKRPGKASKPLDGERVVASDGGTRTGILIMNMEDVSQLLAIAEPWFLALNASVECTPAMVPEDIQKAGPAIDRAVKTNGYRLDHPVLN